MALKDAGRPQSMLSSPAATWEGPPEGPSEGPSTGTPEGPSAKGELLPCGASLALLWEDGGRPPGHRDCPSCTAALAELTALNRTVRAAVAMADETPARDLAARVMDLVRTELRPGPLVPLDEPAGWITETAAARLLRQAAEGLPGVAAGSCRIVPLSGARVPWGGRLPREPLRVQLEIAIHPDLTVPAASTAVRSRVLRAAADHIGLDLAEVDIAVVDVLEVLDVLDTDGIGTGAADRAPGSPRTGSAGGTGDTGSTGRAARSRS
jgi:hypothetical protein